MVMGFPLLTLLAAHQPFLMGEVKKTRWSAATFWCFCRARLLEPCDEIFQLSKGVGVQRIINPATLRTIGYQPGILQDPQVERQPGLTGLKRIGQVTDALLAFSQPFDDADPGLIRKGMEKTRRPFSLSRYRGWHTSRLYIKNY